MALQGGTVRELLLVAWAIRIETIESSVLQRCLLGRFVVVVHCVILWVLLAFLFEFFVEEFPGQGLIV